jgi:hypothetical protein
MGTVFSDSSVARISVGSTISARVRPPEMTDQPKPRKITKNTKPNNPKIIEGIPARISVKNRIRITPFPLPAYSLK